MKLAHFWKMPGPRLQTDEELEKLTKDTFEAVKGVFDKNNIIPREDSCYEGWDSLKDDMHDIICSNYHLAPLGSGNG